MYKSSIGDFPLKDYPCKYWWVRYGVFCRYLIESYDRIKWKGLEPYQKKYNFSSYSYKGFSHRIFEEIMRNTEKLSNIEVSKKMDEYFAKQEIEIYGEYSKDKPAVSRKLDREKDKELWEALGQNIGEQDRMEGINCPFENDSQSVCPFYEKEEFYNETPIEELRKHKGYEVG